jgi:hypothetical protein
MLQVGDVARAAGAINRAMGTMQQALGTSLAEAESGSGSAGSAGSFLRQQAAADERAEAAQQRGRRLDGDSWRGDISFRGVSFSHPGGWSLQDVDFDIPAGQTVALVGPRWVLRCVFLFLAARCYILLGCAVLSCAGVHLGSRYPIAHIAPPPRDPAACLLAAAAARPPWPVC